MRILFKVFHQRSHHNATFLLARGLRERGHEIVYAGPEDLRAHVESQNFDYISLKEDFIIRLEPTGPENVNSIFTQLRHFRSIAKILNACGRRYINDTEFSKLAIQAKPDCILVDSPYALLALSLFKLNTPFGVLQTMVDVAHSSGLPPLDSDHVPNGSILSRLSCAIQWQCYYLKRRIFYIYGAGLSTHPRYVRDKAKREGVKLDILNRKRVCDLGITTVPEFILSPGPFDFPHALAPNQHYVGPSIDLNRMDSGGDFSYPRKMGEAIKARAHGKFIVYCSLGTASWRYRGVVDFFRRLVKASGSAPWTLVLSLGDELNYKMLQPVPDNVVLFQSVPQIDVLRNADLMVTHGGMNSITECIMLGVPMLVYPGTSKIDQCGNAGRVCFHKIGQKGRLRADSAATIRRKIFQCLSSPQFKSNIERMRKVITESPSATRGTDILLQIMTEYFPQLSSKSLPSHSALKSGIGA